LDREGIIGDGEDFLQAGKSGVVRDERGEEMGGILEGKVPPQELGEDVVDLGERMLTGFATGLDIRNSHIGEQGDSGIH
jgi:hypothetical protein